MQRRNSSINQFTRFTVKDTCNLLTFIQKALDGISRNRAKAILTGGGIRVNKKIVKQHDLQLQPGTIVEISKKKPKEELRNKFVKIVMKIMP